MLAACAPTPAAEATPESTPTPEAAAEATPEPTEAAIADPDALPRNETLYFNGLQWSAPNDNNPLSSNSNNWFMAQNALSRVLVFETLYMFNQLDGKLYPLLADGDFVQEGNVFTIKIKPAARWSDGTPLTAHDVVYTFEIHRDMQTRFVSMWDYIISVEATDDHTVVITANDDPEVYNPLKIIEQFPLLFIIPEHQFSQIVDAHNGDPEAVKKDKNENVIGSGPYKPMFADHTKIVLVRDDNYWGQDPSMWGRLPAPRFLAHNIFKDNNAGTVAFQQGEVDMSQQFIAEVWKLWEQGLPISTFIDEPPYYEGASIPSAIFNLRRPGLDNVTVRRALAMAVDYNQIGTTAMSGYTLPIVPSLMNPSAFEQGLIDQDALAPLQWTGNQVDEANQLLDDAGIVDTDGDGIREIDGQNLEFTVQCPTGWTDWNAALEIVAASGQRIGLNITTFFPDAPTWTENMQTGNFDIIMNSYPGASIVNPWNRSYNTMFSDFGEMVEAERVFWNFGRFSNQRADEILEQIPKVTDRDELIALYTELNIIYLNEVPTIGLMYRPSLFYTVNESVWTGFPEKDDGSNIPPTILSDGFGIAGLFNVHLVE